VFSVAQFCFSPITWSKYSMLTSKGLAWPEHGIPVHRVLKPSGSGCKAKRFVVRKADHAALLVAEGVGIEGKVWDGVGEVFEDFVV
jgi:hypothetical protein